MEFSRAVSDLLHILEKFAPEAEGVFKHCAAALSRCLKEGHKVMAFGNGGSAAQAQHFAAELVNRFMRERRALPALALNTDTSALTSIGNDRSFAEIFSRQISALGEKGDAVVGLSTSGTSPNIMEGLKTARSAGLVTVALTGEGGAVLRKEVDFLVAVPSPDVPRIQEVHLILLHLLAQYIEDALAD
jgi:D-sedoheptulose 7-phosphate isomerase